MSKSALTILREKQNFDRKDLASKVGVSEVAISRYENGSRKPAAEIIPRYARALCVSADELLVAMLERKGA